MLRCFGNSLYLKTLDLNLKWNTYRFYLEGIAVHLCLFKLCLSLGGEKPCLENVCWIHDPHSRDLLWGLSQFEWNTTWHWEELKTKTAADTKIQIRPTPKDDLTLIMFCFPMRFQSPVALLLFWSWHLKNWSLLSGVWATMCTDRNFPWLLAKTRCVFSVLCIKLVTLSMGTIKGDTNVYFLDGPCTWSAWMCVTFSDRPVHLWAQDNVE